MTDTVDARASRAARVRAQVRGFYAVLDRDDEALARALVRVARVLQVRIKPPGGRCEAVDLVRIARMARRVCDEAGAALIVNDRLDVALAVGADGVHLGQHDLPFADARRIAPGLWIGVSTHDRAQVAAACAAGADYLGFGPVFATVTKERPDPVQGIAGLAEAVVTAGATPVVAIGGIRADDVGDVYRTGAHALCAISAINGASDPADTARQFQPAI